MENTILEAIKDYFKGDDMYEDYVDMWEELACHIAKSLER